MHSNHIHIATPNGRHFQFRFLGMGLEMGLALKKVPMIQRTSLNTVRS